MSVRQVLPAHQFLATLGLIGLCGACAPTRPAGTLVGITPEVEHQEAEPEEEAVEKAPPPETVVSDSASSFQGFRAADGKLLSEEEMLTYVAAADAICVGERHDHVLDHFAQLRLIEGMDERRAMRGFELGLGLEMVRSRFQEELRAYSQGHLKDEEFETEVKWAAEWGVPVQYYRPQMRAALDAKGTLLALGVKRSLTQAVAERGLDALPEEKRAHVPELDEGDSQHRELFESLMEGHGGDHKMSDASVDNYYQAQLIWDESMAHRAADWLEGHQPVRKLVILAGRAHCHRSAIPRRLERRGNFRVLSVLPQGTGAPITPESEEGKLASGYDFQMVFGK